MKILWIIGLVVGLIVSGALVRHFHGKPIPEIEIIDIK